MPSSSIEEAKKFLNAKGNEQNIATKYDACIYTHECPTIDHFVETWEALLDGILDGSISEDDISEWIERANEIIALEDDEDYED